MKDIAVLFAQGGEVGTDGAERLRSSDGAETPGGLLLELWHADIAFGQIVVEGPARVDVPTLTQQDLVQQVAIGRSVALSARPAQYNRRHDLRYRSRDMTRSALPARQAGVTVIELMIAVVIVGIMAALAAPAMKDMIFNARMSSQASDLLTDFAFARSQAANRGQRVTLCSSSNGTTCASVSWAQGRIVFADVNGDGALDVGEEILRAVPAMPGTITAATAGLSNTYKIQFRSSGMAAGLSAATATFTLCDDRTGAYGRLITITATGRTRTATQTC